MFAEIDPVNTVKKEEDSVEEKQILDSGANSLVDPVVNTVVFAEIDPVNAVEKEEDSVG